MANPADLERLSAIMYGIVCRDRAFQASRNLTIPLIKLPAELKVMIFQIFFRDVRIELCRKGDQIAVSTSNLTSIPPLFLVSTHLYPEVRNCLWRSASVDIPTCKRCIDGTTVRMGSYFISHGCEGTEKMSASIPYSSFPGREYASEAMWRPQGILNRDVVDCFRSASFWPMGVGDGEYLLEPFTALQRVYAFFEVMTWPVRTRGLIEQANDGDIFSVVMENAFFHCYLKSLFKMKRRFELHLSQYQWYREDQAGYQHYVSELSLQHPSKRMETNLRRIGGILES